MVSNDDNGKVVYLSPDGKVLDSFDGNGCDATADRAGNVFVDDCYGDHVTVFDAEHRLVGRSLGIKFLSPVFGPGDEIDALGTDGSMIFLSVTRPAP